MPVHPQPRPGVAGEPAANTAGISERDSWKARIDVVGTLCRLDLNPASGTGACVGHGASAGLPKEPCHPPGEVKGRGVISTVGFSPGHAPTHEEVEKVAEKQASVPVGSHSIRRAPESC